MTVNRVAALFLVAVYLGGLAAWAAGYGVPAWIVGVVICVLAVILCLTSPEGSTIFNFALILIGGSLFYSALGAGMYFLKLREMFS